MKIALVLILVCACASYPEKASAETRGLSLRWNSAALQGVRDAKLAAPVRTRASAIVHTCIYDAWAAYDEHAIGTQLGGALRRPAFERSLANKEKASAMLRTVH
jgi:hypothetical protein